MEQLAGRDHGHGLYVGGHVAEDGQEAIEEGLEALMTRGDDLVEDYDLNWKKKLFRCCKSYKLIKRFSISQ